jgi:hypothetical protein
MTRTTLATLCILAVAACGGGKSKAPSADRSTRDLERPPTVSNQPLNDRPTAVPTAKPAAKPATKPATKPAAKPATKTAAKPTAKAGAKPTSPERKLAPGTRIYGTMSDSINSRHQKAGFAVHVRVGANVKDAGGRVVIPAGSKIAMTVTKLEPAKNKSAKDGKLEFRVNSVTIRGRIYALNADVEPVKHDLKGRGVTAGEVEKVGAGTAIGAVGGRVIGGNTKGAVVGGMIGAGAGTAVAVQTASRDVVVRPGTPVTIVLRGTLVASAN